MFKKFLPVIFLFAGFHADAALIDNDWYTTDDVNNLDWLDLSFTDNKLLSEALDENSGWVQADKAQYTSLISQFRLDDPGLLAEESCHDPYGDPYVWKCSQSGANSFTYNAFTDLFGFTCFIEAECPWRETSSLGLYSDGAEMKLGGVWAMDREDPTELDKIKIYAVTLLDLSDIRRSDTGHFLVRASSVPASSVPEPSIIALFAAGLFGLGFVRRRQA